MARVQQSIEVAVPLHTAYNQLTQFEDYPRFMQDVEQVRRIDDTHLHWQARMTGQSQEWDAEITEQVPDSCIAWRNTSGSLNIGRAELQPVDRQKTRITLTMEVEPGQTMPQMGDPEPELGLRVEQDLARFKEFIESRGRETGEWRGEVHGGEVADGGGETRQRSGYSGPDGSDGQPAKTSSYAAGSEGWDGNEDPGMPVVSSALNAGPRAQGEAEQIAGRQDGSDAEDAAAAADYGVQPFGLQQDTGTQSESLLSQSSDDGDRNSAFTVAEEVSLDMQTGEARRVGRMPEGDAGIVAVTGQDIAGAVAQSLEPGGVLHSASGSISDGTRRSGAQLAQSIDQAVPLADEPPPPQANPTSAEQFAQEFGRQQRTKPDTGSSPPSASERQSGKPSWFPNLFQAWEEPLVRMRRMREEVEQVFDRFAGRQGAAAKPRQGDDASASAWSPALEIAQDNGRVVVSAELPGVKREDVHVEIRSDKLIIEGDRHQQAQREQGGFRRTERSYGHFYRVVALPDGADADGASASMQDGVLQVTVPLQPVGKSGRRLDIG